MQPVSLLRELTCRMGLHSITCHPADVTFPLSLGGANVLRLVNLGQCPRFYVRASSDDEACPSSCNVIRATSTSTTTSSSGI